MVGSFARAGLERPRQVAAAAEDRGREPGQQAGRRCRRESKAERPPIGDRGHRRVPAQEHRTERGATPLRRTDPNQSARGGEHQALGEALRRQPRTTRAERDPHCGLATAPENAREKEVRDIRAGDEQHDRGDADCPERGTRLEVRIRPAADSECGSEGARLREVRGRDALLLAFGVPALHVRLAQVRGSSRNAHARLPPHHHLHPPPVVAGVVLRGVRAIHVRAGESRDRDEDRCGVVVLNSREASRGHADDLREDIADLDPLAEHVG